VRAVPLALAALLALVAGCGGDDDLAPQAPGGPADAPVLESAEPPGGDEAATDDSGTTGDTGTTDDTGTGDTGATPEPTAEPTPDGGAAAPEPVPDEAAAVAPEEEGGGATAPEGEADSPTNDTPPPAGSEAQEFEDFCTQNPGAC
jgi:hypothetical protein